jgi:hypothetical protein
MRSSLGNYCCWGLLPVVRCAMIFARVFVQSAGLRQGLDGLLKLHVVLEVHLVAFGQAEDRDERFLADFAFDPAEVLRDVVLGVGDLFLVEIIAEDSSSHRHRRRNPC